MRSPNYFVVKPYEDKLYNSTKKIADKEIIMSSSIEDHLYVNRTAIVESVPDLYDGPIKKGNIVIVHHNVFRIYYDMKGVKKHSWNHYKDNIFLVEDHQIYLFKNECDTKWSAPSPYLFVTPVDRKDHTIAKVGPEEENVGVISYVSPNDRFSVGDTVVFEKDMEYEFEVDNQKMYRMQLKNLCMKL